MSCVVTRVLKSSARADQSFSRSLNRLLCLCCFGFFSAVFGTLGTIEELKAAPYQSFQRVAKSTRQGTLEPGTQIFGAVLH